MVFEVTVLGSNSAIPTANRNPSAQLLNIYNHYVLVDCGEGTQIQLRKHHIKMQRIETILISHLHGDHFFGLVGLLSTMNLLGRQTPLRIISPGPLQEIVELQLSAGGNQLSFPIEYTRVKPADGLLLHENSKFTVTALALEHRVPCLGFIFREKPPLRKMHREAIDQYRIPFRLIQGIKQGNDFETDSGEIIPNEKLTSPGHEPRSYAYVSDTLPLESVKKAVAGIDLLYHEATFLHEMASRARETFHTTAADAARIADAAGVRELMIGHYSSRYRELDPLLAEAQAIFPATRLAIEGETIRLLPR